MEIRPVGATVIRVEKQRHTWQS